ncbi:MAG TPA: deoxyribonuclease IV [Chloroflexota bacterium]|nr:deoxyribonuclease IV [Chloroflexota bacterium]
MSQPNATDNRSAIPAHPEARPLLGAHCAGGVGSAIDRAVEIGVECLQVFASAPQNWRAPNLKDAEVAAFTAGCEQRDLGPIFLHGIYLMNLASPKPDIWEKSVTAAIDHVRAAERLGAVGLIIHPGSAVGSTYDEAERRVLDGLTRVLNETDGLAARILLETCAGQGNTIGRSPGELGSIIRQLDNHARLAVCLDTCHVFAAGYDITNADGRDRLLEELDREVGLDKLEIIHANDSKGALGSNVDRHDNIGHGQLGEETFAALLAEPHLSNVPFVLEVPGFDNKGPDLPNMETMRRLRRAGHIVDTSVL